DPLEREVACLPAEIADARCGERHAAVSTTRFPRDRRRGGCREATLCQPFDDAQIALGRLPEHLECRLITLAILGGNGFFHAVELDHHHALRDPAPRQLPARLAWRRPPMHPDSKPSDRTRSNTPLPLPSPLAADPRSPALTLADGSDAHKARRAVKARNQYWPTRLGPAWQKHPQCRPSRTRPARRFFLRWPRYDCLAVGLTPEFGHENLSGIHRSSRHSLRDRRCGVFLRRVLQRGRHI